MTVMWRQFRDHTCNSSTESWRLCTSAAAAWLAAFRFFLDTSSIWITIQSSVSSSKNSCLKLIVTLWDVLVSSTHAATMHICEDLSWLYAQSRKVPSYDCGVCFPSPHWQAKLTPSFLILYLVHVLLCHGGDTALWTHFVKKLEISVENNSNRARHDWSIDYARC